LPDDFQLTPHVGAGLLAIQAPQSSRQTASSFIASKPAPTGRGQAAEKRHPAEAGCRFSGIAALPLPAKPRFMGFFELA